MEIQCLEEKIGYKFNDISLLKKALTHTSYAYEKNVESNEKLEFLGDSILEYISSEYIYKNYSNLKEGEMTKVRATVVCQESLSKIARLLDFSEFLYLGKSEQISDGKSRPSILEDAFEAVIAAIYLDGGIKPVKEFIIKNLQKEIENATKNVGGKDYKTLLQEKLQVNGDIKIEYEITKESGPDHNKVFESVVKCEGKILANGVGKSKKHAEMEAAKKALESL